MPPYSYQVQLRDTDAAGVVYFANLLAICHGAYEASLAGAGVNWRELVSNPQVAVPIVHASVDFWRPIFCGDRLAITLTATIHRPSEFSINYQISLADGQVAGQALTKHVAIDPSLRQRIDIPQLLQEAIASLG
jgi:1,4-dihydroxy-2-naphthoyl-CoA hydrolase